MNNDMPWAIILAAGEGSRLRSITTDALGRTIPKQFCSLEGGRTLFGDALARANSITSPERVVTIVASEHEELWQSEVCGIPTRNVIVQPRNRGTAAGILFPLAAVMARDPRARIAVFPSDHCVEKEPILQSAILDALASMGPDSPDVILLGITPDQAVSDYGWILPRPFPSRPLHVERFVEKPPRRVADRLLIAGALWNSFVFVARGATLMDLYARRLPGLLAAFQRSCHTGAPARSGTIERLYEGLEVQDFSRDVLEGSERSLRVLQVPRCGWTDLGTPERVEECLRTRGTLRHPSRTQCDGRPVLARAFHGEAAPSSPRKYVCAPTATRRVPTLLVSEDPVAVT
jgi:mannose-1-phosphate guanylyltransferase